MNSREIDREVQRLATERNWGDFDDPHTATLLNLLSRREDWRRRLQSSIDRIKNTLDHLDGIVDRPTLHLNDLGELQQQPAALEAAVGGFSAADRAYRDYLAAFPPVEA